MIETVINGAREFSPAVCGEVSDWLFIAAYFVGIFIMAFITKDFDFDEEED